MGDSGTDATGQEPAGLFARLARRAAPSIGGLPIQVRLPDPEMEVKKEAAFQ